MSDPNAAPPAAPAAAPGAPAAASPPSVVGAPAAPAAGDPPPVLGQPAADAPKPLNELIPEKYRVTKEDGTFDVDASVRKAEEARVALESRIGTGDVRPKTVDDYKLVIPEQFKALEATLDPAVVKSFQQKAFDKGITQGQYEWIMAEYFPVVASMADGLQKVDTATAIAELRKAWPVDADFQRNVGRANAAIQSFGGEDAPELFKRYGNDPMFARMMAKIGAEMGEDKAPKLVATVSSVDIGALERSEAYRDPKHADHARVSAQVRDYYQRTEQKAA